MNAHHLPVAVEDRGAGAAALGVAAVPQEGIAQLGGIDHRRILRARPVLEMQKVRVVHDDALRAAAGMLEDVHRITHPDLALLRDHRVPAKIRRALARLGRVEQADDGHIKHGVGEEEALRVQPQLSAVGQPAKRIEHLEADLRLSRDDLAGQDVVVGHHQVGRDEEPRSEMAQRRDLDPGDRARGQQSAGQESDRQDVVQADDPLAPIHLGHRDVPALLRLPLDVHLFALGAVERPFPPRDHLLRAFKPGPERVHAAGNVMGNLKLERQLVQRHGLGLVGFAAGHSEHLGEIPLNRSR